MKILILSDFYPPIIGGMENHVSLLSRELLKRGHKVSVFTIGGKHVAGFEEDDGVRVNRFEGFFQKIPFLFKDPEKRYHPPIKDLFINKKLKRIIKIEKPDIIHSHGWILYSALSLKDEFDIPLVATLHDYGLICPKRTLMTKSGICKKPFETKCIDCGRETYALIKSIFSFYGVISNKNKLKVVDKFIAVSSFVKKAHTNYLRLNVKDIVVIPNFYEVRKDTPRLGKSDLIPKDFILFVGILAPHKGVDTLIESYDYLKTKTKMVLIGAKHKGYCYRATKNIIIIENAPNNLIQEAYSKCRFVIIPSEWPEPCPTVAFEAMTFKKAIIASNIGGLKEIIKNNETGLLVPPNNPRKLTKAIKYLLERPTLAYTMGAKGYHRIVENFTVNKVLPQIESVYEEVISRIK